MNSNALPPPRGTLFKQHSWSPDTERDNQWLRRKNKARSRSQSVTDDDLEELRGCIELGFGFSTDLDPKLVNTLPALGFYCKVNKHYLSRSSSGSSISSNDTDSGNPADDSIIDPGEDAETVKARLRQWAQVVACSVRQL